jgi:LPXTG-site transpeptidase (sortase) family protein
VARRRLVAAAGLALVVPSVAGIVALAASGDSAHRSRSTVVVGTTPTPERISASTTAPPPPSSTPNPAPTDPPATTSTSTTTTIAPIATHDARVGVGVLVPEAVNAPVRVEIPSIGADGPVQPGGVDGTGGLEVPRDAHELVWWKYGPTPGGAGSAVIAGHLDWKHVLGIFNHLAQTKPGDPVTVTYADGTTRAFVVDSVELVDKPAVSVDGTFSRDGAPVLRLVTCGGEFDFASHHYRSNVVVTAHPV